MNITEEKAKIRKEIRRRRREISSNALREINKNLPDFIFSIDDEELQTRLSSAKRVALYRAIDGEVPVDGLAEALIERGIKCCFPRIEGDKMVFADCESLSDKEFSISSLKIQEPLSEKPAVDPKDIDVVVLPALAYNEEGTRLGAGGGFYDRFIGSINGVGPYLLGICYEFQLCSDIPYDEYDISADFLAVIPGEEYEE